MQTLTLKVPPEISNWLDQRAKELNQSKSEIVRQAITAQFTGEKKLVSLLDRAGDLVGMYKTGRKDSSHKKHLKTLGLKSAGRCKRS